MNKDEKSGQWSFHTVIEAPRMCELDKHVAERYGILESGTCLKFEFEFDTGAYGGIWYLAGKDIKRLLKQPGSETVSDLDGKPIEMLMDRQGWLAGVRPCPRRACPRSS